MSSLSGNGARPWTVRPDKTLDSASCMTRVDGEEGEVGDECDEQKRGAGEMRTECEEQTPAAGERVRAEREEQTPVFYGANENVALGPFDGKVGAVVRFSGEGYYITTNASYIPAPPIRVHPKLHLREDMRYGEDDPTQWPQKYSSRFCHLGAIQKKPTGTQREISVMWWNATVEDFISPETGKTATRGLGKLSAERFSQLLAPIARFREQYTAYSKSVGGQGHSLLPDFVRQIRLGVERLQSLPSTFNQMVAAITTLQRMFLEADALLKYVTQYKPLMEHIDVDSPTPTQHCVGVFTSDPAIAQQLKLGGLLYWLMRPTHTFGNENILAIAEPLQPADLLQLKAARGCQELSVTNETDSKIEAIHKCSVTTPWYKDPFSSDDGLSPSVEVHPSPVAPVTAAKRYEPFDHPRASTSAAPKQAAGRDKFQHLDRPEMPTPIPAWEAALAAVNRARAPAALRPADTRYVLPEPALVVASEDPERRQLYLHHLTLMMDALLYRIGDAENRHELLSSQEWRDVLNGKTFRAEPVPKRGGRGRGQGGGRGGDDEGI
ncbi:hypothetical protein DFH07DRAFT_962238 [Mycena maculata]|uniref:Uncharacterized protein n=1 Tax=Mycena maculata TaxID=230809 RepID=A0AAD7IQ52_9AGAR|nr:hypothetical protein DFH07DRAFT_962238 [Mycena maculata]